MIEVILREEVRSLGKAGDLVRVKPGYARNYLLPKGFAYEATTGNKKRIEAESKARTVRLEAERAGAEAQASTLKEVTVTLARKAGDGDRLFGSITSQDIAEALEAAGHSVDKRKIDSLNAGEIPIYEPGLEELVRRNRGEGRLSFSTDLAPSIDKSKAVFIAVGTPPKDDGSADLKQVLAVAGQIGQAMNGPKVIVVKSTVPPGSVALGS